VGVTTQKPPLGLNPLMTVSTNIGRSRTAGDAILSTKLETAILHHLEQPFTATKISHAGSGFMYGVVPALRSHHALVS